MSLQVSNQALLSENYDMINKSATGKYLHNFNQNNIY